MDLWIRSQDRKRLVPNPNLYVVYDEKNEIAYIGDTSVGHIGKYKTEKRALEVLDEIQNILQPKISVRPIIEEDRNPRYIHRYFVTNGNESNIVELNTYVYEMPKE